MNALLGVLPLVVLLVVAIAMPLLSERIIERALVHSEGWQARGARSRRPLSRLPGTLVVMMFVAQYVFTGQHWL